MANLVVLEKAKALVASGSVDYLIKEKDYYFQKLEDLFTEFTHVDVNGIKKELVDDVLNSYLKNGNFSYEQFSKHYESNAHIHSLILLIGKIVSYCDDKAYNKRVWNEYNPHRVLAKAMVTMTRWVAGFLEYKLGRVNMADVEPSVVHTIQFIEDPEHNLSMLSDKHRRFVSQYVLQQDYDASTFEDDVFHYFSPLHLSVANLKNKGHLISRILYDLEIKKEWTPSVQGLLVSDGTGWQDETIEDAKSDGNSRFILWNTKKPSGTNNTIKLLRQTLNDEGHFDLFYVKSGQANYYARVIDFAGNKDEYAQKSWRSESGINGLQPNFADYVSGNKRASIIFLASEFRKIDIPIPIEKFVLHGGYDYPRQDNISPFEELQIDDKEFSSLVSSKNFMEHPLNQILYGPPGTGKTYNTINHAIAILHNKSIEEIQKEEDRIGRKQLLEIFDDFKKQGFIEFITFHQNYSYEEFVQGLRPVIGKNGSEPDALKFSKEDGIFKKLADRAFKNLVGEGVEEEQELTFDELLTQFLEPLTQGKEIEVDLATAGSKFNIYKEEEKYIVFRNSAGNSFKINKIFLEKGYNQGSLAGVIAGGLVSYYAPVLNKLKKIKENSAKKIVPIQPHNFVLIIDEINRANISRVFGELITLIEEDKRWDNNEKMKVKLPSGDEFTVPKNLYIIGTMNTADKSIALLDIALRRRFEFIPLYPDESKVVAEYLPFFVNINNRIKKERGADFAIGHANFMNSSKDKRFDFRAAMNKKVIPLLNEYFHSAKEGLVKEIINSALSSSNMAESFELKESGLGILKIEEK